MHCWRSGRGVIFIRGASFQDLSQPARMFPNTWETFIQNCGVTTWFGRKGPNGTREYVSKLSGTTEVLSHSRSVTIDLCVWGTACQHDSATQFAGPCSSLYDVGQIAPDENDRLRRRCALWPYQKAKRKFYFRYRPGGKYRNNPYVKNGGSGLFGWLFR